MARKSSNMKFVNHCLGKGPAERQIAPPVITIGIGHDTFQARRGIIARPRGGPAVVSVWHRYGQPVRINKHLLAVEPKSPFRGEGAVRSIGVYLTRPQVRHKDVPVVIGAVLIGFERDDRCRLDGIHVIEQKQLDEVCIF